MYCGKEIKNDEEFCFYCKKPIASNGINKGIFDTSYNIICMCIFSIAICLFAFLIFILIQFKKTNQ